MLTAAGDRVLLTDGAAELNVTDTSGGKVRTEVVRGGVIRSRTGVNVPSERLTSPALTDADRDAVPRALSLKADLIAQSFVRSGSDVRELRDHLREVGGQAAAAIPIVAKIETRSAVDAFDEIVREAEGVMVARGDLGVDLPFEDVPLIQKMLLRRSRDHRRFTIVATQMLESMTAASRPTRAEASDVANAVLDGTDAVMLSAETAIGDYPIEAARAALSICFATERDVPGTLSIPFARLPENHPEAVVHAAVELSLRYPKAAGIWCFTRSGRTAELLSSLRPRLPIVAFTTTPTVARRLASRNAVVPVVLP
jgi:pyruvate kinase